MKRKHLTALPFPSPTANTEDKGGKHNTCLVIKVMQSPKCNTCKLVKLILANQIIRNLHEHGKGVER
jgi:hypothetical protein